MNKFKQLTAKFYLDKRLLALLLVCLLIPTKVSASFKFDHFTVGDGLSQGTIFALFQDQQGFIRIGTEDGLNRFDGYDFVTYMWVGTNRGGINLHRPITEYFSHIGVLAHSRKILHNKNTMSSNASE